MKLAAVVSATVLACFGVSSDALYIRNGDSKLNSAKTPRIVVIRQNAPASSRAPAVPARAPAAPAPPASAPATPAKGQSPASGISLQDMYIADLMDVPYIPNGFDPVRYHLSQKMDIPYIAMANKGQQSVDPLHSMIIAETLDFPHFYV